MPAEVNTDEELMERYVVAGDKAAFNELFKRYAGRLTAFFMRSIASRTDATDLVQQTFLHFHRARADFTLGRLVRPWLYTIAINVKREYFRRRGRKPETQLDPIKHGEPSRQADVTTPERRAVRRALLELPEGQREVIVLHWYQELSFPEIADLLGASVSAVKVRAHRGYNKLRAMLEDPSE